PGGLRRSGGAGPRRTAGQPQYGDVPPPPRRGLASRAGNDRAPATVFCEEEGSPPARGGTNHTMLSMVLIALGLWVAASFLTAPLIGRALRRCDQLDHSAGAARALAQHPASRPA